MEKYFTVEQVAEQLQVSPRSVRTYLRDGILKGQKFSNQWRISSANLQDFISNRKEDNVEPVDIEQDNILEVIQGERTIEEMHAETQRDVDRIYPYPYQGNEKVWNDERTGYYEANTPNARCLFYLSKLLEAQKQFSKIAQEILGQKKSPDDNFAELLEVQKNIYLLERAGEVWAFERFKEKINYIKERRENGSLSEVEAMESINAVTTEYMDKVEKQRKERHQRSARLRNIK